MKNSDQPAHPTLGYQSTGLTKREKFAETFMGAMIASPDMSVGEGIAKRALGFADELLQELDPDTQYRRDLDALLANNEISQLQGMISLCRNLLLDRIPDIGKALVALGYNADGSEIEPESLPF